MRQGDKLVVVKGYVRSENDRLFINRNVNVYLEGLSEQFGSVIYASKVKYPDEDISTPQATPLTERVMHLPLLSVSAGPRGLRRIVQYVRELSRFRALFSRGAPVIAHVPNSYVPLMLLFARPRRVILYVAGDWLASARYALNGRGVSGVLKRVYYRWALRYALRKADAIVCAGKKLYADVLNQHSNVYLTKPIITLLPHATTKKSSLDVQGQRFPFTFLFVGSFVPRKNLPLLIRCIKRLLEEGASVQIELVGYGPEEKTVRDMLGDRYASALVMHGFVSDHQVLSEIYQNADCLVIPSSSEGFPRVIYEAMAHGLPVIATKVGGIPLQLDHDETASLVEPEDEESLYAAMKRIIEDDDHRLRLHKGGLRYAAEVLDEPAAVQHARIVREVLHGDA